MLDISFIRLNEDIVRMMSERRGVDVPVKKLLEIDDKRRAFTKEQQDTSEYAKCIDEWRELMLAIPNLADISAPNETTEVERVGDARSVPNLEALIYTRGDVHVYTDMGTRLVETLASVRTSFFTSRDYVARTIVGECDDISHFILLERPSPTTAYAVSGTERDTHMNTRLLRVVTGSHSVSVDAFESVRKELTELCTLLRIPYFLELVGVRDMPHAACKMYRLSLSVPKGVRGEAPVLAEWYYEHDYSARRYGMLYSEAADGSVAFLPSTGKKKYAHTVRVTFFGIDRWLEAVAAGNTMNGTCMLPPALHARIPDGKVVL